MSYEITGIVLEIFNEVQVNERFKKREFVLETNDGGFSEQILFQLTQDKTSLIDGFNKGDRIKVFFNIKGNKWKDRYFVNLQAWRISGIADATADNPPPPGVEDAPPPPLPDDDLPF